MNNQQIREKETEQQVFEGRWNNEEHQKFLQAIMIYGKNWKLIEQHVQTRSASQVRSHAQKFFLKLLKIQKERKRNRKKQNYEASKVEKQLIESLLIYQIVENTPLEIITFLRKDPVQRQIHHTVEQNQRQQQSSDQKLKKNTIIEEMLQAQNQDSSFLVTLIKHNMELLRGDQHFFTGLIDWPQYKQEERQEEHQQEQTTKQRKRSFNLIDDEDEEKYQIIRNKINNNQQI